jgi:hypothetical protein
MTEQTRIEVEQPTVEELQEEIKQLTEQNRDLAFRLRRFQGIVEQGYNTMAYGHLNHEEMAARVRMLDRHTLEHEGVVTGARDRIAYLANQVEDLKQVIDGFLPDGYKLLKTTTHQERNWHNHKHEDDAQYSNVCGNCGRDFLGYKRDITCRHCATECEVRDESELSELMCSFASLDALRRRALMGDTRKTIARVLVAEDNHRKILVAMKASKPAIIENYPIESDGPRSERRARTTPNAAQALLERKRQERLAKMKK